MSALPTKAEILKFVRDNPDLASKRDIARAFGVKGQARIALKQMIRELRAEGALKKTGRKAFRGDGDMPPVALLKITGQSRDGDLTAQPVQWEDEGDPPPIQVVEKHGDPALGPGDRFLARMRPAEDGGYEARLLKKIAAGARRALGVFRAEGSGGRLIPVDRKADEMVVPEGETGGAKDGELVEATTLPGPRMGLKRARVVEVLGDPGAPRAVSLIAIHMHGIPNEFPDAVLEAAERAKPATAKGREDLRHLPLITIDPADARDHDDAICAAPDDDPSNEGGHVVWVAIADVAHYVRPGSPLDREARKRGNSTYFPDRVVPMLPERLSGDLCSLHEGVERPCIAARMVLDKSGSKIGHSFHRGWMRSPAALTYEQAQAAVDGAPDEATAPLLDGVLTPLFEAYAAAAEARDRRAPLHLDLPERRIELDETGRVTSVNFRERLDAHRLVEEFMILANVAAAETLEAKRRPLLYRVHEEPDQMKLAALREQMEEIGLSLAEGQVLTTKRLNALLDAAAGGADAELVNLSVLRAQMQAYYNPENYGHFGLALRSYAHFTSPIRRYADLIVHRALIAAHGWGDDGLSMAEAEELAKTAEHISMTERRSMEAERDTTDRYLSAYLAERTGAVFEGRIVGVARFGAFVKLDDTGADGLIPVSHLGSEYFTYDDARGVLRGERSGKTLAVGARAVVRLKEAAPLTGGLLFEPIEIEGFGKPSPRRQTGARGGPRKPARDKARKAKAAKKAKRKR